MADKHITFVPGNGVSLSDPTTEAEPSRHRLVRNCRYPFGNVEGRDSECSYYLEDLEATDPTVTHSGCQNAFRDHFFDKVLASNLLLLVPNPEPSKCPMCNDLLYPWPALVGPLLQAGHAAREAKRQAAVADAECRRRAANTQAQRAFIETAGRRPLADALGPNVPQALVARIQVHFDRLDVVERQRWTADIENFAIHHELAARRDEMIADLTQSAADANDLEVVAVVHACLTLEAEAHVVALEASLAGLVCLRAAWDAAMEEAGGAGNAGECVSQTGSEKAKFLGNRLISTSWH